MVFRCFAGVGDVAGNKNQIWRPSRIRQWISCNGAGSRGTVRLCLKKWEKITPPMANASRFLKIG